MNNEPQTVTELEKTQSGRLFSIFGFSTAMIYLASQDKLSSVQRNFLYASASLLAITVGTAYIITEKRLNAIR